jgi:hypothetical protein
MECEQREVSPFWTDMAKYPEIEPIQSTIGKILLYINVTMER